MNANREQQRAFVADLLDSIPLTDAQERMIHEWLRLREVTVEVPEPAPTFQHGDGVDRTSRPATSSTTDVPSVGEVAIATVRDMMFEDLRQILLALGLSDAARPRSAHEVVQREILPAIRKAMGLPSEPDIAPGTTGAGVVTKGLSPRRGIWAKDGGGRPRFYHADSVGFLNTRQLDEVTDFVPDPEPLTAEAVERVIEHVARRAGNLNIVSNFVPAATLAIHEALAPYVAKGGAR